MSGEESSPAEKPTSGDIRDENSPVESEEEDIVGDGNCSESEAEEVEDESYPVKKPSSEEKEDEFDDCMDEYEFFPIGTAEYQTGITFKSEEEIAAFNKYVQQHNESGGFDIDPCPVNFLLMLHPIGPGHYVFDNCITALHNVLKYMKREKQLDLELVEAIKANYRPCHEMYATFKAKHKPSGEIKLYQCMVYRNPLSGVTTLWMFRERPEDQVKTE